MGFMDMREWMRLLEKAGELRRITAEVDWDREIGAVARRVLEKKGPALLFENIKGYGSGRCTQLFVSGLGARSRLALALGFYLPSSLAGEALPPPSDIGSGPRAERDFKETQSPA